MRHKIQLLPSMYSMTVSAQKAQIAFVRLPILKSPQPIPYPILWSDFSCCINVVNFKNAKIVNTAFAALCTKFIYEGNFSCPKFGLFMLFKGVFIPVILPASISAKALLFANYFRVAIFAAIGFLPPILQVTGLRAVKAVTLINSILMDFIRNIAFFAIHFNFWFSHLNIISFYRHLVKPKYFDIACKRIETAYKQPRLFDDKPQPKAVQASIFDEVTK